MIINAHEILHETSIEIGLVLSTPWKVFLGDNTSYRGLVVHCGEAVCYIVVGAHQVQCLPHTTQREKIEGNGGRRVME
jgi:hypothetical protein